MATIKIVSWNVNGIRAAHRKGFLDWFEEERPDILCVQETKANEEQFPADLRGDRGIPQVLLLSGEEGLQRGCACTRRLSRSAWSWDSASSGLTARVVPCKWTWATSFCSTCTSRTARARTERLEYKMDFYEAFLDHIETLRSQGRNIIVCGDVNTAHKAIDLARPKANEKISGFLPIEREWIDKLVERGYVDTFRMFNEEPDQYSWWNQRANSRARNVGWRIDYFFVNEEFRKSVKSAGIHQEVMGSDHCPISLEVEMGS